MSKKITASCTLLCLLTLALPAGVFAGGEYKANLYQDLNKNGKPDNNEKSGGGWKENQNISYEGFVPCGNNVCANGIMKDSKCEPPGTLIEGKTNPCQLCHAFVMANGMISYLLINIVPILAVFMLVIGGVMFYFGGANPGLLGKAKTLIKGIVIGLFLIYGAYMIIGIFLAVLGAAEISTIKGIFKHGVFSVKCPIDIPY